MATGLIHTLEAERTRLKAEGNAIRTLAEGAGDYTDEQRTRRDVLIARLGQLDADISAEASLADMLREAPAIAIADGGGAPDPVKAAQPFASLGSFLQAVKTSTLAAKRGGAVDRRLLDIQAVTGAVEQTGADGGYRVQKDHAQDLMRPLFQTGVLAAKARHIPIGPNSNGWKTNVLDETSRADSSRGAGVLAYWEPEATTATATRPKFKPMEMTLAKLLAFFYATDEELQDDVQLGAVAGDLFRAEMGFKVDDAIVRGTGAGIPLGWLNAAATVSVSKETGQTAATIVAENIEKMYARMPASSLGNAEWFINVEIWPQLFQLAHAVGTGGVPVFVPAGGLSGSPFGTLLGRPITPIEHAAALGTVGDINLVDMSQYVLIEKGGPQEATSIHVEFLTDQQVFRWVLRTNGQPYQSAPLTPYKGSATAMNEVMGGQVQFTIDTATASRGPVQAGKL